MYGSSNAACLAKDAQGRECFLVTGHDDVHAGVGETDTRVHTWRNE